MLRTHTCGQLRSAQVDQSVTLCGWVNNRRDHGGVIFVDLRDRYGLTQVVFDPSFFPEPHQMADQLRSEWVIEVTGKIQKRSEGMENPRMETGDIEMMVEKLVIHNQAKTPPFELESEVREDLRLEYRYLDLRRHQMQRNMMLRSDMVKAVRDFFHEEQFLDVETPIMVKGTPEGAREYLVPSRLHHGEFYVLPQSPQQLKQLLMCGGIDRYYQIARCFRDEDLRADRQPEFTQLDMEMSFVDQEDVLQLVERCFRFVVDRCGTDFDAESFYENGAFQRITWQQSMELYGSDKPDVRFGMTFVDLTEEKSDCGFGVFEGSERLFALKVPGGSELSRKDIDELTDLARKNGAGGLAWVRVGEEAGPVMKNSKPEFIETLIDKTQAQDGDLIFFGAGAFLTAVEPLGAVRLALGDRFGLRNPDELAFVIVKDFPLLEIDEQGRRNWAHHPFTMPHPDDIGKLDDDQAMMEAKAWCYDFVVNGVELGSGSIRIHDPSLQKKVFKILGLSEDEIEAKFGHILKAFSYGCPPHGGYAFGIDRLAMILARQETIREVIAFPKNQSAQDLMLGAPSVMPEKELGEQNIQVLEIE